MSDIIWKTYSPEFSEKPHWRAMYDGRREMIVCQLAEDQYYAEVDGCDCSNHKTLEEAQAACIKRASRRVHVKATTTDTPTTEEQYASGWGNNARETTVTGDVRQITIEVDEDNRFGITVDDGRIILTTYGRALSMLVPQNLVMETDQRQFQRMRNSVQHQDDMMARLCADLGEKETWKRIMDQDDDLRFSAALVQVYRNTYGEDE